MPSTKNRINLTVPDDVYQALQEFKARRGIFSNASAVMQLLIVSLRNKGFLTGV